LVTGSKTVGRVSQALVGQRAPGARGIIPTAVLGTGVFVTLSALDTQLLGGRLQAISIPLPVLGVRLGLVDLINFLIFFQGPKRLRSAVTAVGGSKIITGAVSVSALLPSGLTGGLPIGLAAAGGSSAVAAGSQGAPV